MKRTSRQQTCFFRVVVVLSSLIIALAFSGCKEDAPPSLYDLVGASGATPTITSIVPLPNSPPPNTPLAGVSEITITGSNFSANKDENLVFFDAMRATVISATTTQLKVVAPNLPKDSIKVKIAVHRSEMFSDVMLYKLDPSTEEVGGLGSLHEPFGLAGDITGNIYVSMLNNTLVDSVYIITPTGERRGFSRGLSSAVPRWTAMKMGPGGYLYTSAVGRTALFRIPPGGGNSSIWQNAGGLGLVTDFDFDQNGNIWAGGNNPAIYRVTQARNIKPFTYGADVRGIRVYNGYVYAGGLSFPDSVERVVRFKIVSADSLGPREDYFNLSTAYPGAKIYAITFAIDGEMYVGTDASAGSVIVVSAGGGSSRPLYPGLLKGQTMTFTFNTGVHLYLSRTGTAPNNADKKILRINVQKQSAPYYGRQL